MGTAFLRIRPQNDTRPRLEYRATPLPIPVVCTSLLFGFARRTTFAITFAFVNSTAAREFCSTLRTASAEYLIRDAGRRGFVFSRLSHKR